MTLGILHQDVVLRIPKSEKSECNLCAGVIIAEDGWTSIGFQWVGPHIIVIEICLDCKEELERTEADVVSGQGLWKAVLGIGTAAVSGCTSCPLIHFS